MEKLRAETDQTREKLAQYDETFLDLTAEEKELVASEKAMTKGMKTTGEDLIASEKRLEQLQSRNDKLAFGLAERQAALSQIQAERDDVMTALNQARSQLSSVREEHEKCLTTTIEGRKEIEESDALAAELGQEIEALKAEMPVLLARRATAKAELQETFASVERFGSGAMAEVLLETKDGRFYGSSAVNVRSEMKNKLNRLQTFERLVLSCIEADVCK